MSEQQDVSNNEWMRDISEKMGKVLESQVRTQEDLSEIKVQTTKTNGRVGKLEKWRSWATGIGVTVIVFVGWWIQLHSH